MAKSGGRGKCIDQMTNYVETGLTGTGSSQSIPHTLGSIPDFVEVHLRDTNSNNALKGTHTSTDLVVTVTNDAVFDIVAWKFKYPL